MTPAPDTVSAPPSQTDAADLLARLFHGLADPTRLRIVQLLLERRQNVGDLVAALGVPQGRVSSHLMCLRWCGFVTTRRAGKYVYYRVGDPRVIELVRLAQELLIDHAHAIVSCNVIHEKS